VVEKEQEKFSRHNSEPSNQEEYIPHKNSLGGVKMAFEQEKPSSGSSGQNQQDVSRRLPSDGNLNMTAGSSSSTDFLHFPPVAIAQPQPDSQPQENMSNLLYGGGDKENGRATSFPDQRDQLETEDDPDDLEKATQHQTD